MAQQQTENNLNELVGNQNPSLNSGQGAGAGSDLEKQQNLMQNGINETKSSITSRNYQNQMSEQKVKSPGGGAVGSGGSNGGSIMPPQQQPGPQQSDNNMIMNPYGEQQPVGGHHQQQQPPPPPSQQDNMNKDPQDPYGPPPPHPPSQYPRYHADPNDPYGHYHHHRGGAGIGGKPMIAPNRPPQRYMPTGGQVGPQNMPPGQGGPQQQQQQQQGPGGPGQQPQQGPTPTLNSLLQSHPPPPSHRYANSYDVSQQQQQQQQPPPPQPYGPQQGWAPPPRPYSPQPYHRTPPPVNVARGQSPYPPPGQGPGGGFPPQQGGGPSQQGPPAGAHYPPYPQRYPTPPGPAAGPNHRSPYPPHQYPDPSRSWPPGGPSPAGSPGPGGHSLPPPSPQQQGHGPPQSPGHAPSPSPQPPQPAQSPHQFPSRPSQSSTPNNIDTDTGDPIGQNSNDSSSGGATGLGTTPGTPNSQAMRPTPSPTGSTGSRSMSPAVGQQSIQMPPRPSSSHSQAPNQQTQASNCSSNSSNNSNPNQSGQHLQQQQQQHQPQQPPSSLDPANTSPARPLGAPTTPGPPPGSVSGNMAAQGSYQTPPPPPTQHMHGGVGGYKMGPGGPGGPGGPVQNMPPYSPQSQQYSGNYSPRPQYPGNYGPPPQQPGQPPTANNMPPGGGQYPGNRQMPNHVSFPPYQQNWGPPQSGPQGGPGGLGNHVQGGKGGPPPPSPGNIPRAQTYLKHHLQHKGGYAAAQSPTPPQGYGNGPGMHPPMAPPHHMGPPMGPTSMGPPSSAPQNQAGPGPNSHGPPQQQQDSSGMPPHPQDGGPQDNGVNLPNNASQQQQHPVTSIVTTGPDGAPLDEVSQQSTLSNASAASGEDPSICTTPKSRKNEPYNQTHLGGPPTASPGGGPPPHGVGPHEDFEMGSPNQWSRTPASPPVFNHVPQETFRTSKKSDSLCKLFDMDQDPERRPWLDKLLGFMDERRTPITACPTISKTPLDLYRLYLYVKERGGFVEVCKVTKSKTWKDIAGLLGIGASSSAAYTLRKHYTKNLLAYECHFDRGGIDPLPIIQQIEAGSKKKSNKAASVPSPGICSSNSQDSFPAPGPTSASMDGYGGYPGGAGAGGAGVYPPPGVTPDYNQQNMQRPPSQSNTQSPHPGQAPPASGDNISVNNPFDEPVGPPRTPYQQGAPYPPVSRPQGAPYQGPPNYNQYGGPDQYPPQGPPGQYPPSQGQFPASNRSMYPPYGPPEGGEPNAPPTSVAPPPTNADPYRGYTGAPQPYPPPPRPYTQQQPQQPPAGAAQSPAPANAPPQNATPGGPPGGSPYPPQPAQQDYYRPDQSPQQPRRHPDFTKEPQPYSPYQQRPAMYGNWPNNAGPFRGQYPPQGSPQQWGVNQRPPGPQGPQQPPGQWDPNRYMPPGQQPPYQGNQPNQPQWGNMPPQPGGVAPGSPMRPQQRGGKPFPIPQQQQQGVKPQPGGGQFPPGGMPPKREIVFPPDSVEATTPVLYRRKRLGRSDTGQIDAWRVFMSLRSGLLSESTWALDVLNILLFDDTSVHYFGLIHLPGLLDLLLDHFQKSLCEMFNDDTLALEKSLSTDDFDDFDDDEREIIKRRLSAVDLGSVIDIPKLEDRVLLMTTANNYTMNSRKGLPVKITQADEDIFVLDDTRKWDLDSNRNYQVLSTVGHDPWSFGNSQPEPNSYIMDCFRAEMINIPFATRFKSKNGAKLSANRSSSSVGGGVTIGNETTSSAGSDDRTTTLPADINSDNKLITNNSPDLNNKCSNSNGDSQCSSSLNFNFNNSRTTKLFNNKLMNNATTTTTAQGATTAATTLNPIDDDTTKSDDLSRGSTITSTTNPSSNSLTNNVDAMSNSGAGCGGSSSSSAAVLKKEPMDSDCRSVDMELEPRIPNGPQKTPNDTHHNNNEHDTNAMDVDETLTLADNQSNSDNSKLKRSGSTIVKNEFDVKSSVKDPAATLKRRRMSDYEDECYTRDEASLYLVTESQDSLARRCVCLSNILRNLTFVPGNETELVKSSRFLSIVGKLLLLHHEHPVRTLKTRNYDREEDADFADSCSSLQGEAEWWWDYLVQIRENMLVIAANISGQMDLSRYEEFITRPILDGLLHWAVCPSAHGQDAFPTCGNNSPLSPQRLALEALCKLCVTDANVDLVIATPPFLRLEKLCAVLTRHLCRNEDQVLREFSVNLLHYLAAADSAMARTVAMQSPCISYLVAFIEQAEQTALGVANQNGINYLRENPDSMGTSLDMLRRAAGTLLHLARHPDNRPLFMQQEQRLLGLVMSHILDQQVALIISRVLFQVSRGSGPVMTSELNTPFATRPTVSVAPCSAIPSTSSSSSCSSSSNKSAIVSS